MTDIAYRCHHCGSTHEAESIRENLYINQQPIASYGAPTWGTADFGSFFRRRRLTRGIARALWPRYPHYFRRR
jgi:hypothetical protein